MAGAGACTCHEHEIRKRGARDGRPNRNRALWPYDAAAAVAGVQILHIDRPATCMTRGVWRRERANAFCTHADGAMCTRATYTYNNTIIRVLCRAAIQRRVSQPFKTFRTGTRPPPPATVALVACVRRRRRDV